MSKAVCRKALLGREPILLQQAPSLAVMGHREIAFAMSPLQKISLDIPNDFLMGTNILDLMGRSIDRK